MSYLVAVRALCAFSARSGDLDLRFTPSPSALEGMAGHAAVAARRHRDYESEVSLNGRYRSLRVRGRADGYDPRRQRVEEIKTFRGDLNKMPDNHRALHWAQARIYGWLLCEARQLQRIEVALVYFNIGTQKETVLVESHEATALKAFFETQCECFLAWAEQENAHRLARDAALAGLAFPHAGFRPGQRELATAVYQSARAQRRLLAQAPTGIGKTIATLFPLLKAAPAQNIDKVFFLTAKTSGRQLALEAVQLLRRSQPALPLRVLELVARDKACEHPDKACHGDACPLAQGFYDRIATARQAAIDDGTFERDALRTIALAHAVCPYYLSQELARWADVVIGDYNYYFDSSAMLYALTNENQWRVGLLVDEAHNMIDRARGMYSATLDQTALRLARQSAPRQLKRPLDRVQRSWNALCAGQEDDYAVHAEVDASFLSALQQCAAEIGDLMAEQADAVSPELQSFMFDVLHFARLAESFGTHSMFDITRKRTSNARSDTTLALRNIIPAPFIQQRFASTHTATLFSATLTPWHFHKDTLGLPDDTAWIDVASPFSSSQLSVQVARAISTRFQHRERSLPAIADLMANQFRKRPGNYLAFFSSFDYLARTVARFNQVHPDIATWQQSRGMEESARSAFLERFQTHNQGIGFAVLGGAFGEGIDLPGERLIGAFIATLGLPQINPVNEQMRARMEQAFGDGYCYTYLFPGLQKVVQAAGRVIRTREDSGIVHLMDDRFASAEVRALLPAWWTID